jgi:hypothetical protein
VNPQKNHKNWAVGITHTYGAWRKPLPWRFPMTYQRNTDPCVSILHQESIRPKDYENLTESLTAFATLATIQFAIRRLARM